MIFNMFKPYTLENIVAPLKKVFTQLEEFAAAQTQEIIYNESRIEALQQDNVVLQSEKNKALVVYKNLSKLLGE